MSDRVRNISRDAKSLIAARKGYGLVFFDEITSPEVQALSPLAFKLLVMFWAMAGTGDQIYPKQSTLAKMVGRRRQAVNAALGELERVGLVERRQRGGRGLTYVLCRPPSLTVPAHVDHEVVN